MRRGGRGATIASAIGVIIRRSAGLLRSDVDLAPFLAMTSEIEFGADQRRSQHRFEDAALLRRFPDAVCLIALRWLPFLDTFKNFCAVPTSEIRITFELLRSDQRLPFGRPCWLNGRDAPDMV